jgi:hypothetical protein
MNKYRLFFVALVITNTFYPRGGHGGHGHGHHGHGHRGHGHHSHGHHHGHHKGGHHGHHGYHNGHHHYYGTDFGNRNFIGWWWANNLAWPYGFYGGRRYVYPVPVGYWGVRNMTRQPVTFIAGKQQVLLAPGDTADIQKTPNSNFMLVHPYRTERNPHEFQSAQKYLQIVDDRGALKIQEIK